MPETPAAGPQAGKDRVLGWIRLGRRHRDETTGGFAGVSGVLSRRRWRRRTGVDTGHLAQSAIDSSQTGQPGLVVSPANSGCDTGEALPRTRRLRRQRGVGVNRVPRRRISQFVPARSVPMDRMRIIPPLLATWSVLSFGVLSLIASFHGDHLLAAQCILTAAVLDAMDGALARRLKAETDLGAQLDSLCDMVSFGIAPALLVATGPLATVPELGAVLAPLFVVAGSYRLARFNVGGKQNFFHGMPITIAGAMLACLGALNPNWEQVAPVMALLAFLMVSKLPYHKGKAERPRLMVAEVLAVVLVWYARDVAIPLIGAVFLVYGVAGPARAAFVALSGRRRSGDLDIDSEPAGSSA